MQPTAIFGSNAPHFRTGKDSGVETTPFGAPEGVDSNTLVTQSNRIQSFFSEDQVFQDFVDFVLFSGKLNFLQDFLQGINCTLRTDPF